MKTIMMKMKVKMAWFTVIIKPPALKATAAVASAMAGAAVHSNRACAAQMANTAVLIVTSVQSLIAPVCRTMVQSCPGSPNSLLGQTLRTSRDVQINLSVSSTTAAARCPLAREAMLCVAKMRSTVVPQASAVTPPQDIVSALRFSSCPLFLSHQPSQSQRTEAP